MSMIKVLVLDVNAESELEELTVREIEDELHTYYEIIGCRCIDIPRRKIGGVYYDIICDDEGLLKDYPKPSMIDNSLQPMIVGTVVIAKSDDESGEMVSLDDEDIARIKGETVQLLDFTTGRMPTVIKASF